ncbi:similar to Saccharomyces cerevisiae YGR036C CAX4 Dolichyl pyrophosphate (Dol-P-P) phosphatase with a luminally oriented active site in the ER [Maudiozyma barnettii]|uniref:Dolichyldiphosphatase n=1 Tax=Maudiozyma barnettii TaxID=61262 RepID=A0A8H2VK02_9SACH|nr:dolichyldiphosphatase [Kazachstania barnettii]CAB4256783.1 similar to Saccharomyces cerevisiae YGR036C CAX4 Dolichyl pyrophosphate (Dol-P-P) phosphatase with a luminally oriented active site in the ER [Kazachstania barnettii]CAD1785436.1 similar to Saccharomyces cerevisiae YGR036C CAX4 Dolichyl pyrophosphate (Dol-P-P) phosphatase with a luminally oriented active site in the ER [Kazachstania barnettii]
MFNLTDTIINYDVIPFDDTLIMYNPHDPISVISVFLSLSPILLLTFYLSWLIITRELESIIVAGGQLLNEFSNKIFKRLIKQPRPHEALMGPGYGMPSAHSQFVGFFLSYWTLKIWLQWDPHASTSLKTQSSLFILTFTLMVCGSRIYLLYHTLEQVTLGYLIGIANGTLYFMAVGVVRQLGLMDWLLAWPLAQACYLVDSFNSSNGETLRKKWAKAADSS